LNHEEFVNFQKSYSLDPFPVQNNQVKKRITDKFRKRRDNRAIHAAEPVKPIDCNGITSRRIQRSDHTPLLVNTKRWHSLELNPMRPDGEHYESSSGCEELIDNKKSLGIIKSWLVGIFQGSKNPAPNGSGLPTTNAIVCPAKPASEERVLYEVNVENL
jgi:hypothetical protein